MRAQIWGCLGQMAHRRQIAQWVGTRTTHPAGTGFEPRRGLMMGISPEDCRGRLDPFPRYLILRVRFETGPCPKPGCESACFPQGLFPPPKTRPWVFRRPKRPVFIENLGIACGHSRRFFFSAPRTRPWVFRQPKRPISSSRNSPTSPRWSPY